MFCPFCGEAIQTHFTYCPFCGWEVSRFINEGPVNRSEIGESPPEGAACEEVVEHYLKRGPSIKRYFTFYRNTMSSKYRYDVEYKASSPWFM